MSCLSVLYFPALTCFDLSHAQSKALASAAALLDVSYPTYRLSVPLHHCLCCFTQSLRHSPTIEAVVCLDRVSSRRL